MCNEDNDTCFRGSLQRRNLFMGTRYHRTYIIHKYSQNGACDHQEVVENSMIRSTWIVKLYDLRQVGYSPRASVTSLVKRQASDASHISWGVLWGQRSLVMNKYETWHLINIPNVNFYFSIQHPFLVNKVQQYLWINWSPPFKKTRHTILCSTDIK